MMTVEDINKENGRKLCNVYIDDVATLMALTEEQIHLIEWLQNYFEIECVEIDKVITL